MGATGTAVLDFGAYPGTLDASVAVTGQGSIVSGSLVEAWIRPVATAEHSADEHIMAVGLLDVVAHTIVSSTGFTITGLARDHPGIGSVDGRFKIISKPVARMYGTFTIAWAWA